MCQLKMTLPLQTVSCGPRCTGQLHVMRLGQCLIAARTFLKPYLNYCPIITCRQSPFFLSCMPITLGGYAPFLVESYQSLFHGHSLFQVHAVRVLIKEGLSPVARDEIGATPLHYAAQNDSGRCIRVSFCDSFPTLLLMTCSIGWFSRLFSHCVS